MPIWTPKPRIAKINWENPITNKLLFDVNFFQGGGSEPPELTRNIKPTTKTGTINWKMGRYGWGQDFVSGNASFLYNVSPEQYTTQALTLEALVYPDTSGESSNGRILNTRDDISTNTRLVLDIDGATNSFGFRMRQTNGSFPGWGSTNGSYSGANKWYHVIVTMANFSSPTKPNFYINGKVENTYSFDVGISGTVGANGPNAFIGNTAAGTRDFDGVISYVRWWNRAITPWEARQLYANPFGIYVWPKKNYLFKFSTSAQSSAAYDFRVSAKDTSFTVRDFRLTGRDTSNRTQDMRLTGKDTSNRTQDIRLTGKDTSSRSQDVRLTGRDTSNRTQDMRLTGKDTSSRSQDIRLTGKDISLRSQDFRLIGTTNIFSFSEWSFRLVGNKKPWYCKSTESWNTKVRHSWYSKENNQWYTKVAPDFYECT